jgi:hypothetical protein
MKMPERTDRFLAPTTTIVGSILLIADIWGGLSSWWACLYVPLLFTGHSQEYKLLGLWQK